MKHVGDIVLNNIIPFLGGTYFTLLWLQILPINKKDIDEYKKDYIKRKKQYLIVGVFQDHHYYLPQYLLLYL